MKILYSAGNRPGAQQQAIDIIKNCHIHCPQHTFKLSAYLQSSTKMPTIDWLLDPIINNYGKIERISEKNKYTDYQYTIPKNLNKNIYIQYKEDVRSYDPDLIITDGEITALMLAYDLHVPVWSCSPLNAYYFIVQKSLINYVYKLRFFHDKYREEQYTKHIDRLFIYSPMHATNLLFPCLRWSQAHGNYDWIVPYHAQSTSLEEERTECMLISPNNRTESLKRIFDASRIPYTLFTDYNDEYQSMLPKTNLMFCTGETRSITDAIYNDVRNLCIIPDLNDWESIISASLGTKFLRCFTTGDLSYMRYSAPSIVERIYNCTEEYNHNASISFLKNSYQRYFHQALNEYEKTR